jgi:AraC-like DNA-binding protein
MLAAALHAGFGSYTQFHRVFTATMGRSPREWKKRAADGG